MRAVKGNREYTIAEEQKESYLNDGYDIYDESGAKIANGKGKIVTVEQYETLLKENDELKEKYGILQNEKGMAEPEEIIQILKEYAALKNIDVGQAATVKGIIKKIREAGE